MRRRNDAVRIRVGEGAQLFQSWIGTAEYFSPRCKPLQGDDKSRARIGTTRAPSYQVIHYHGDDEDAEESSSHYDVRVWTSAKGPEQISVGEGVEGPVVLVTLTRSSEAGEETVHAYEFPDQATADAFHEKLDRGMLEFGWSFDGYLPQRR